MSHLFSNAGARRCLALIRFYAVTCLFTALPCASPAQAAVLPGIDVLISRKFDILQGKRVGLITNQTGRSASGESTIDILNHAPGVRLAALFSPEHGIRGEADDKVGPAIDRKSGIPIHSLYGTTCRPTPEMLRGLDVLVFDIQDIGTRFYTYIGTLSLAMAAAREAGIPFVVLDRPNPIGGVTVEGAVPANPLSPISRQDSATEANKTANGCRELTSIHPIPTRHGMTVGELARLFNAEFGIACNLVIVPMTGWRRSMYFDETGFPWINPSPNMKDLTSAILYPGLGIIESTTLSVGRGTERPFQMFGAPWVDGPAVARDLEARHIPGIRFAPCRFVPTAPGHPYRGRTCSGVCVSATERDRLDPVLAGLHLVQVFYRLYPQRFRAYEGFAIEVGSSRSWNLLTREGKSPAEVAGEWNEGLQRFAGIRTRYLLY
jgi:uncharacterized protein YbbC (DUF1343 family)